MNYRHLFHAGNFADVFKHVALILLLRALRKKETPFCYVETHAGSGRYDLTSEPAQRSGEYRDGIARLWDANPAPELLTDYFDVIRAFNPDGRLRFYPGSPRIARHGLRTQDRIVLCEQQPDEYACLKAEFVGDRQVAVHERDGYEAIKALLPLKERRGLVLIDPPYEQANEFDQIVAGLDMAHRQWPTGTYMVWFPIKDRPAVTNFYAGLKASPWRKLLVVEFMLFPEDTAFRLNGCGLAVLNPPWGFDRTFSGAFPHLEQHLGRGPSTRTSLQWFANDE